MAIVFSIVFTLLSVFTLCVSASYCCYNETIFHEICCQQNALLIDNCCDNSTNSACLNKTTADLCKTMKRPLKELHLGAFVPYSEIDRFGFRAAMELAVEMINNRSDILGGHKMVLHYADTFYGDGGRAVKALFNFIMQPPNKVMLIGPARTDALMPVAEAAVNWNLLQISYASLSPMFGNNRKYRNTYRIVPSSESNSKAKVSFIKNFGWERVAIIHEYSAEMFSLTASILVKELVQNNISVIAVEGFQQKEDTDVSFQINKLKNMDSRIIIGEFSKNGAQKVFCEAYKHGIYGPRYVWIVFGHLDPLLILEIQPHVNHVSCSREELKEALQGVFATAQLDLRQDDNTTISGMTATQFMKTMQEEKKKSETYTSFAFDSVWSAAVTLDEASKTSNIHPDKFNYNGTAHASGFRRILEGINFEGVTGPVRFSGESRERVGTVMIMQLQNESWVTIGQHFTYSDSLDLFHKIEWQGGRPPKDRTLEIEELLLNPLPLIVVTWLLAGIGALLSIFFLYFNVVHRGNRSIKMSSPQLNNFIILGCLLCYASVVLFGLDGRFLTLERYGFSCNARTTVLSIGFSLSFGAMFSKTWRVHKIFTAAKTLKKMAIRDIHLFGIVAALVIIDIWYLSIWFGFDSLKATKIRFDDQARKEHDKIYIPVLYQCTCTHKTYFLAVIYAYKGILLLFGLFLAWETRNVTIPALNDSKYIGMSVYNVVTLSCIGAIVTTALDGTIHYQAPYAITSLCLIICTTATLLLVFVPKVYNYFTGSDDQAFNVTTVHTTGPSIGRHQSHGFRFNSDNDTKACYLSKSVQTDHSELATSTVNGFMANSPGSRINSAYEIQMDDIELNETLPTSLGGQGEMDAERIAACIVTNM
ncbi:gamma-aminobutyric acid type B receptor subunit 2 isoform X1 [Nematostella vectensis]|uniref:gamma-aminobutyric acid type B receptor subunit 2 isoform X1 n=1 Tax=Nematostella vectensis TaxID=45351 RepID=UPI0020772463|nr:gamma-aminobutyric acid type B receptor subunit 2 isoform X1 [Nematostella vectensis]XP_032219290.2 gamma-aminobutyric acid type B receptor subunit 2 isoform X1 [Nematostella vectensis]XP_032219292.2 gamma-aminobutyric acid type B receptor subunit 2 isoform X1 [Nematostella vectensis]XP_032219293.2 gamma-aminobutyric acid type B receptor subunit 2 isoform X1 [Nematostella vectensis]XP_032219294.2 gamma-aminobutyric acid type B receptor subunit 2 isoform X1 [Nematostella vectensis]XP_0322192